MSISLAGLRQVKPFFKLNVLSKYYSTIVVTNDGSTIVALHPEEKVPYDRTKPLPSSCTEDEKSVLKMNDIKEIKKVFSTMNPEFAREELMRLTQTTVHRWYPRSRDKRAKKTPMDREYL